MRDVIVLSSDDEQSGSQPPSQRPAIEPLAVPLPVGSKRRVTKRTRGDCVVGTTAAKRVKRGGGAVQAVVAKRGGSTDAAGMLARHRPKTVTELVTSTSRNDAVKRWLEEAQRGSAKALFLYGPSGSGKRTLVQTLAAAAGFAVREWREEDSWSVALDEQQRQHREHGELQQPHEWDAAAAPVAGGYTPGMIRKASPIETFRKTLLNRQASGVVKRSGEDAPHGRELILISSLPQCAIPGLRKARDDILCEFAATVGGGGAPPVVFLFTTHNAHSNKYLLHAEYPDAFLNAAAVQQLEVHAVTQAQLKKRLTAIAGKETASKQEAGMVVEAVMQRSEADIRHAIHELAFNLLRPIYLPKAPQVTPRGPMVVSGVLPSTTDAATDTESDTDADETLPPVYVRRADGAVCRAGRRPPPADSASSRIGQVVLEGIRRGKVEHDREDSGIGGAADFVANKAALQIGHATARVLAAKRVGEDPQKPLEHPLLETLQRLPVGTEKFLDYAQYSMIRYAQTEWAIAQRQAQRPASPPPQHATAFDAILASQGHVDPPVHNPPGGAPAPPAVLCLDRLAGTSRRMSDGNVYGKALSFEHRNYGWAAQCYFLWSVQLHAEHPVPPSRAHSFEQCHPPPKGIDTHTGLQLTADTLRPAFKDDIWSFHTNRRSLAVDVAPMLPALLFRRTIPLQVANPPSTHPAPFVPMGNRPVPFGTQPTQPQPNRPVPFGNPHPSGNRPVPFGNPHPSGNRPVPFGNPHPSGNRPVPFGNPHPSGNRPVPFGNPQPSGNRPVPFGNPHPSGNRPVPFGNPHPSGNRPVPFGNPQPSGNRPVPFVSQSLPNRSVQFRPTGPAAPPPPPPPPLQLTAPQLKYLKEMATYSTGQWQRGAPPAKGGRLPWIAGKWERPRVAAFNPNDLMDGRVLVGRHEEEPAVEAKEDPSDPIQDFDD